MYEHHRQPMLPMATFIRRLASHGLAAAGVVAGGVLIGMLGFRITEGYSWTDAFLNSCMLLGGMGQVTPIVTSAGKIFAGFFALFAGLVFLAVATILLAPWAHRILHWFHLER